MGNSCWLNSNFQGYDLGPSNSLVHSYTVPRFCILYFSFKLTKISELSNTFTSSNKVIEVTEGAGVGDGAKSVSAQLLVVCPHVLC